MSFEVGDVVHLKSQYKSKIEFKKEINRLGYKPDYLNNFSDPYYDVFNFKNIIISSLYLCRAYKTDKKSITANCLSHYYPQELFTKYNLKDKLNKLLKL